VARNPWRRLPARTRRIIMNLVKLVVTIGGFYLLLTHQVATWMKTEHGVYFAPIDGAVTAVEVDGQPLAQVPSADGLRAGDEAGWAVDSQHDLLYVHLADGNNPVTHAVSAKGQPDLGHIPIARAIRSYVTKVDLRPFLFWSLVAMLVKFVGVLSSAFSWNLLLRGQRLKFPFWGQVVTAFLIGRFIGTFMPSTIGLDGYTLYEAGHYSNRWHRALTAKALEKFVGLAGLFTGLLLTLPAGYPVLHEVAGQHAPLIIALMALVCSGVTGGVVVGLARPRAIRWGLDRLGRFVPGPIRRHLEQFTAAVTAYHGRLDILFGALLAKFVTHFTTAVVYFFTALAIGVVGVQFVPIVFGSLIQIFGTVFSPTIAGEGAREALQALLLSNYLGGAAQAVLSAALVFIAAEAATLWGGAFLWTRTAGWRPSYMLVDGEQVDYAWLGDDRGGFDADELARHTRGDAPAAG